MTTDTPSKRILIFGLGVLGGKVLDFLCQSGRPYDLRIGVRDPEKALPRINLARFAATNLGAIPKVSIVQADISQIEATAETIARIRPDIIFNATTLHSWWVITQLPPAAFRRIDAARGGVWTPMHMVLTHRLMLAVKQSGVDCQIVNASYPDVVNPALAAIGLAPTIGIGNLANTVPGLRFAAARQLGVDPDRIDIRVFGHHYFSYRMPSFGTAMGIPHHLAIYRDGELLPQDQERDEAIFTAMAGPFRRVRGVGGQPITASSAANVVMALADEAERVVHAPGPLGLVGGYPVRVQGRAQEIALPDGLSLEQAIEINQRCQVLDGIASVDADGTVRFTEETADILRTETGYDCTVLPIADCEDRAGELAMRFADYRLRAEALADAA